MEAAVRNSVRSRMLCLVNGAFSERFAEIGRSCCFDVDEYAVPWGEAHDPDALAGYLEKGRYDAVSMAHSETSTGVLNDIRSLAEVVRRYDDTMVLVDSVTGFGGAELRPDAWGLDFVLTGSQKAFALPPGLSFGVASQRMMDRAVTVPNRGYYFDLERFAQNHDKDQSPVTPALSVMYALEVQLERMLAEGIENRWARHAEMAGRTWAWVDEMREGGVDLSVVAPHGNRSPSVTAVRLPDGVRGPDVTKAVIEREWLVGGGYGKLKDSTVRVGHMGDHTMEELNGLLEVLGEVLR
jgi:aspartate aminotransferase-like enzyme